MARSSVPSATGAVSLCVAGTSAASASIASRPTAVAARNAACQSRCSPSHAPAGTPGKVATARPLNMIEIAEAWRFAATSEVATTAPTPKNVPWASEVSTRAAIKVA